MSDKEEKSKISKVDAIIIEEVKERPYLYDTNVSTYGITLKERRKMGFQAIANKLEQLLDVECRGEDVSQRWVTMRKGLNKALKNGIWYYLQDHLRFLEEYLKLQSKESPFSSVSKRTPYKPLKLSPVQIYSDNSTDTEDLTYNDVLGALKHIGKKNEHPSAKSANNSNEECENEHCASWNIMQEIDYFNEIKDDIKKVPRELQVKCLLEICETAQNYIQLC